MLYQQTPDNLIRLVREVGVVKREQLFRFFSDAEVPEQIEYYIHSLLLKKVFLYNKEHDTIAWHCAPKQIISERENRINAFWIPTSFKSKKVKEIIALPYPFQFLFITHDDEIYDIAVCNETSTALICRRRLEMGLVEGIEDEVNHIMLVRSEEIGTKLKGYGFDNFCVLDKLKRPQYYEWV